MDHANYFDDEKAARAKMREMVAAKLRLRAGQITLTKNGEGQCSYAGTVGGKQISGTVSEKDGLRVDWGPINEGMLESNAEEAELFRKLERMIREYGV